MSQAQFWTQIDTLVRTTRIFVDRPRNTAHPKYPQHTYPLDYGYLEGTSSGDGDGIDVWLGAGAGVDRSVVGVICTVDMLKRDMEVKLLIGCSHDETALVQEFFTGLKMGHQLVLRDRAS
jgi:inorganic pyrophosphatase